MQTTPRVRAEDIISKPTSAIEVGKRSAARAAVDEYVENRMIVGVGSGSTIVYGIQRLAERVHGEEQLQIVCIPTSFQSRQLLIDAGLAVSDLNTHPEVDVAIDGADEVDPFLNCVKGGGGCQTEEKLVAAAAATFVVVADCRKQSQRLLTGWRKGIPLEVLPSAWRTVTAALEKMGGKPRMRMAIAKAGPVITDGGNMLIDVDFENGSGLDPANVAALHVSLKILPGVVETGLFPCMARRAYFGADDGNVQVWNV